MFFFCFWKYWIGLLFLFRFIVRRGGLWAMGFFFCFFLAGGVWSSSNGLIVLRYFLKCIGLIM